jgi:hypothetical protein
VTATVDASSVQAVLDKHPQLNDHGWGAPHRSSGPPFDMAARRLALCQPASLATIASAVEWLKGYQVVPRPTKLTRTSYGLKHVAEEQIGYITNGAFLVAVLLVGIPIKVGEGPNPVVLAVPAHLIKTRGTR